MSKRRRGRPRKIKGGIESWQLARAAIVMSAYDEARTSGEKHSVAVEQTVEFAKQDNPAVRISASEVKRILANFRPRNATTILCFERSIPTAGETERIRSMLAQVPHSEDQAPPLPPNENPPMKGKLFKIRFCERPNYPRVNRKMPAQ